MKRQSANNNDPRVSKLFKILNSQFNLMQQETGVRPSSDDENAPRGINFLFDPRSLNVAISRAQCLSIIIMNKALFKANANNIQQLKMINNFHTLRHYSHIMDGSLFK